MMSTDIMLVLKKAMYEPSIVRRQEQYTRFLSLVLRTPRDTLAFLPRSLLIAGLGSIWTNKKYWGKKLQKIPDWFAPVEELYPYIDIVTEMMKK